MKRVALAVVLLVVAGAGSARADRVFLRGGGVIEGEVVADSAGRLEIEVGPGRMTIPRARVERIETGASALATYRARAATLSPRDSAGWMALGRWARANGLLTQAAEAFTAALASDPANPEANEALGRVAVAGRWVDREEAFRAQGLVPFEGEWMTPAEREALVAERVAAADARRADAEAEARLREAEARARAAEAEARRAEAEARAASEPTSGIPYDWILTGGPYGPVYGPVYGPIYGVPGHGRPNHGQGARRHGNPPRHPDTPIAPPRMEDRAAKQAAPRPAPPPARRAVPAPPAPKTR